MANEVSLLAIVGPTASGKSGLAIKIAQAYNGEIIAADSRTLYRGMDIGTAKPTPAERSLVPHHLIDIVNPDEAYSAADFQKQAKEFIRGIQERGRLPILVGGTGLYINSVILDYDFSTARPDAPIENLRDLSLGELQALARAEQLAVPEQVFQNPRHLAALIARGSKAKARLERPTAGTLVVGIDPPKAVLDTRIAERVAAMFTAGLEAEAQALVDRYGWDAPGLNAIGYREFKTPEHAQELIVTSTRQLAKRQLTWLKRGDYVQWFADAGMAYDFIVQSLQKR